MIVDVRTDGKFQAQATRVLFDSPYRPPWDLAPDGRFLMMRSPVEGRAKPEELHIIKNWPDELRRLAPLPR